MRVALFAGAAIFFGVLVLIHTENMDTIPQSALDQAKRQQLPRIHADASNCSVEWIEQKVDHFSWLGANATNSSGQPATYQMRYLLNTQFWDPSDRKAPLFFYTGNEGDVTLYANHTGLIWENAHKFKALVVFAEHRYYGESLPFGADYMQHLQYLSHEQALADYTELIYHLQSEYEVDGHPVIAFGGSYGGMLSAWFRMKYPSIVHGAIAASAPILGFPGFPSFHGENYWSVVTRDASPITGAAANCVPNARKAWSRIFALAETEQGRANLTSLFNLCKPLASVDEGEQLAMSVLFSFDNMAMGNFPYPSSYLTGGVADLPAWPVRVACEHLAPEFSDDEALLSAVRDASNVFNNASKDQQCYKIPSAEDFDGIWDFQWCTQMLPQETYFNSNGETDMFWKRTITQAEITAQCQKNWGVTPDPDWIRVSYGDAQLKYATNIVFSNGLLDPWSSGGVRELPSGASPSLKIVTIEEGAHHLDLFFSHELDPESVTKARKIEIEQIHKWIDEFVGQA